MALSKGFTTDPPLGGGACRIYEKFGMDECGKCFEWNRDCTYNHGVIGCPECGSKLRPKLNWHFCDGRIDAYKCKICKGIIIICPECYGEEKIDGYDVCYAVKYDKKPITGQEEADFFKVDEYEDDGEWYYATLDCGFIYPTEWEDKKFGITGPDGGIPIEMHPCPNCNVEPDINDK